MTERTQTLMLDLNDVIDECETIGPKLKELLIDYVEIRRKCISLSGLANWMLNAGIETGNKMSQNIYKDKPISSKDYVESLLYYRYK